MSITLQPGKRRELNVSLRPISPAPATLWGYVTDAESGAPISGATVTLGYARYITAGDGRFEIAISAGTYDMMVEAEGYETAYF
jgi:uncharacterized membrane protein